MTGFCDLEVVHDPPCSQQPQSALRKLLVALRQLLQQKHRKESLDSLDKVREMWHLEATRFRCFESRQDRLPKRNLKKHGTIYYQHINVLSKDDNLALSKAFFRRFGPILKRFGFEGDEDTLAFNTRAALDCHRQVVGRIIGIAKRYDTPIYVLSTRGAGNGVAAYVCWSQ